MEPDELSIQYIVEVTGGQGAHEAIREAVEEIDGAELQREVDKAGYFEADSDE